VDLGAGSLLVSLAQEDFVAAKEFLSSLGPPAPELPRADGERAQQCYRHSLGFDVGSLYPTKDIGAVIRRKVTICFRKRQPPFEPAVHCVFAEDVDAVYDEMKSSGANIVDPLEDKPWRSRQFTVEDFDGTVSTFTVARLRRYGIGAGAALTKESE
jgi:hypothetical protein